MGQQGLFLKVRRIIEVTKKALGLLLPSTFLWKGQALFGEDISFFGSISNEFDRDQVNIGSGSAIRGRLVVESKEGNITLGDGCSVGGGTVLASCAGITVGSNCLISYDCLIIDSNNHSLNPTDRKKDVAEWRSGKISWTNVKSEKIRIGDDCWVGARVIILPGVVLGECCVVGAGSVVTKSFPPWSLIAGNPAKLIRLITND